MINNIFKKIKIVTHYKNIHYIIFGFLIILISIALTHKYNKKEYFIGNKTTLLNDDDGEAEKKDYSQFPPKSKYDLINNIFGKQKDNDEDNLKENENKDSIKNNSFNTKDIPISLSESRNIGVQELEKSDLQKSFSKIDDKNPLLGTCDFYFNKCPNNKSSMATIKGNNLTCGKNNIENKKAEAIAQIKNGFISKITILNPGLGYNYQNPPKISINSSKGNGASAKAIVDKNSTITSIDIIDYGYGYIETPSIEIEPPQMDGVCHLCC